MLDQISSAPITEARRQVQICNACRYCEGYCSVFPALMRQTNFADGDLTHLANLCHNCRGCYYACQYTEPHEFALNLPAALAEVRTESWERYIWPSAIAGLFQKHGMAIVVGLIAGTAILFAIMRGAAGSGDGFYAFMSHALMVAIFAPAFLIPLGVTALGLRTYARDTHGKGLAWGDFITACRNAATMKNLSGGQGQGCNFEDEDRYTKARRSAHQAVLWGFLLCFASTSSGTILHYVFDLKAPYGFWSLPKLLGVPGGIMMTFGAIWLAHLKTKADPKLGAANLWGGEMAFTLLIGFVGFTGLILYAATGTGAVAPLLAIHLGAVLTFFVTLPYTKMAHGFFRMMALTIDAAKARHAD